jgi:endonuclease-3
VEIRELHDELVELHGAPETGGAGAKDADDRMRQLLTTILSQNVADTQTKRASAALFEAYPDYAAIENADTDELADVISVVGLKNQKARRIQRALGAVRERNGGDYSLGFLDEMGTDEAQNWLEDIKGVGPKTANVVLSFGFGKPSFAVDTHIERLSKRFGMIDEKATNARAHEVMNEKVPDEIKYSLHVLLIRHGREYCTARNPDCENPVCARYCSCEGC